MSAHPETILIENKGKWKNRVLIGTPAVGLVRMEWVVGRYGQTLPTNWSHVECMQWMSSYIPLKFQIADAENIIAKHCVEQNFEWFLSIEHDNVLPPNTFIRLNEYMIRGKVPVVGALYFTKSEPPEPMIYREFGRGYYDKWKMGDKVWCKGLPFGCTLIHGSIIKALWKESPEYMAGNILTRRVFKTPSDTFLDPETNGYLMSGGTSDLEFCRRCMEEDIFTKAGWPEYQKKEFPFLVDTNIYVTHIDNDGVQWPLYVPKEFQPTATSGNGTTKSGSISAPDNSRSKVSLTSMPSLNLKKRRRSSAKAT